MRIQVYCGVLALVLFTPAIFAKDARNKNKNYLSLARAIELSLMNHPKYLRKVAEQKYAEAESSTANIPIFKNPEFGFGMGPVFEGSEKSGTINIALEQSISIGGQRAARMKAATAFKAANELGLQATKFIVEREVSLLYHKWLIASERANLTQMSLDYANELKNIAGARLKVGKVSPLDYSLIAAEATVAQSEALKESVSQGQARKELLFLLGKDRTEYEPVGALNSPEKIKYSLEELQVMAQKKSLRVKEWGKRLQYEDNMLKFQNRQIWPDLGFGVSYEREGLFNKVAKPIHSLMFNLKFEIPIFNRNTENRSEQVARLAVTKTEFEIEMKRQRLDIAQAFGRLKANIERVTVLQRDLLPSVKENLEKLKSAFSLGQIGIAGLLQSKRVLYNAKKTVLNAYEDYFKSLFELEKILTFPVTQDKEHEIKSEVAK